MNRLPIAAAFAGALLACGAQAQQKKGAAESEQDLRIKVSMIKPNAYCVQLGRVLRKPDPSVRGMKWEAAMRNRSREFDIGPQDIGYIMERRLRIGMAWCALYAAIGEPDHGNRTVTASGERHQLVYSSPRRYVYLENNRVSAWQD